MAAFSQQSEITDSSDSKDSDDKLSFSSDSGDETGFDGNFYQQYYYSIHCDGT